MKHLSFIHDNAASWGVVGASGAIVDLGPTGANLAPTLHSAISNGIFNAYDEATLAAAPAYDAADIDYAPTITDPEKIICVGVNYRAHQKETGKGLDMKVPTIFTRWADTQIGHLEDTHKPSNTTQFDYEGELAVVIGAQCHRVSADEALDYVAGYGIYNDFTCRDWQRATSQWGPGKNFPHTGAFGPELTPADEFHNFAEQTLTTRVNGEVRQHASLGDLYFTIPQLIEHITGFTVLRPGDVIITGTPGGVGLFMDPPALLHDGDTVEVEITGLGSLVNTVKDVD